eukprot:SAG11_NODE_269_length_11407_cov_13.825964_3_plen_122_part_00
MVMLNAEGGIWLLELLRVHNLSRPVFLQICRYDRVRPCDGEPDPVPLEHVFNQHILCGAVLVLNEVRLRRALILLDFALLVVFADPHLSADLSHVVRPGARQLAQASFGARKRLKCFRDRD